MAARITRSVSQSKANMQSNLTVYSELSWLVPMFWGERKNANGKVQTLDLKPQNWRVLKITGRFLVAFTDECWLPVSVAESYPAHVIQC